MTKERFKSFQKRGLIEPRKPAPQKKGKRVMYVGGERTDKAVAATEEVVALRKARVALEKQGRKGQAKKGQAKQQGGGALGLGAGGGFTGGDLWG